MFACLSASQNRLFPLGRSAMGLCVVETRLQRTEFNSKNDEILELLPAWRGLAYFKIYDNNYNEVFTVLIDSIKLFRQEHYVKTIEDVVNKGMLIAKSQAVFLAAEPKSLSFCQYSDNCPNAKLYFDTKNNTVFTQLSNQKKYKIEALFNPTSIAANLLDYMSIFEDNNAVSAKSLKGNIYVNSVRQFQIGNKLLTLVHIGCGQNYEYRNRKSHTSESEQNIEFTNINKSVFEEPVLHHGHGFDFFIWE